MNTQIAGHALDFIIKGIRFDTNAGKRFPFFCINLVRKSNTDILSIAVVLPAVSGCVKKEISVLDSDDIARPNRCVIPSIFICGKHIPGAPVHAGKIPCDAISHRGCIVMLPLRNECPIRIQIENMKLARFGIVVVPKIPYISRWMLKRWVHVTSIGDDMCTTFRKLKDSQIEIK